LANLAKFPKVVLNSMLLVTQGSPHRGSTWLHFEGITTVSNGTTTSQVIRFVWLLQLHLVRVGATYWICNDL